MANSRFRVPLSGGGELALEAMDEYQLEELGRTTYEFCRNVLRRNPELRQVIKAMEEQIRAEEAAIAV